MAARSSKSPIKWFESFLGGIIDIVADTKEPKDGFNDLVNLTPYASLGELLLRRGMKILWYETTGISDRPFTRFDEVRITSFMDSDDLLCGIDQNQWDSDYCRIWTRLSAATDGYSGWRVLPDFTNIGGNDAVFNNAIDSVTDNYYGYQGDPDSPADYRTNQLGMFHGYYNMIIKSDMIVRFAAAPAPVNDDSEVPYTVAMLGRSKWPGWMSAVEVDQYWTTTQWSYVRPPRFEANDTDPVTPTVDAEVEIFLAEHDYPVVIAGTNYNDAEVWVGVAFRYFDGQESPVAIRKVWDTDADADFDDLRIKLRLYDEDIRPWAKSIVIYTAFVDRSTDDGHPNDKAINPNYGAVNTEDSIYRYLRKTCEIKFSDEKNLTDVGTYHETGHIVLLGTDGYATSVNHDEGQGDYYYVDREKLFTAVTSPRFSKSQQPGTTFADCEFNAAYCAYRGGVLLNSRVFAFGCKYHDEQIPTRVAGDYPSGLPGGMEWSDYPLNAVLYSHLRFDGTPYYDYFPGINKLLIGEVGEGWIRSCGIVNNDLVTLKERSLYRTFMETGKPDDWYTKKVFDAGVDVASAMVQTDRGIYFANSNGAFSYSAADMIPQNISDKLRNTFGNKYIWESIVAGSEKIILSYNNRKREVWFRFDSVTLVYNEIFEGWYSIDRTPDHLCRSIYGGIVSLDNTAGHGVWYEDVSENDHAITSSSATDTGNLYGVGVYSFLTDTTTYTVIGAGWVTDEWIGAKIDLLLPGILTTFILDNTVDTFTVPGDTSLVVYTDYKLYPVRDSQHAVKIPLSLALVLDPKQYDRKKRVRKIWYNAHSELDVESGEAELSVTVGLEKDGVTASLTKEVGSLDTERFLRTGGSGETYMIKMESVGAIFEEAGAGAASPPPAEHDADGGIGDAPSRGTPDCPRGIVVKNIGAEVATFRKTT